MSYRVKKQNENYVKYYFTDTKELKNNICSNISISCDKIDKVYKDLVKKYGEIDIIKDYSIYKYNNLELTIFPDGSSFSRKVKNTKIKDEFFSDLFVIYMEKFKIPNDCFPCQYSYDSSQDIIDIVFKINNNIDVVLSTKYENETIENIKEIKDLIRPNKLKTSKKSWCELTLNASCYSNIENIHKTIKNIKELL